MAAVRNEPCALEFAMEEVQADVEVASVAVRGAPAALQYVSRVVQEDRRVLHAMVEGYISRKRSFSQPITVERGLHDLKEFASASLRAKSVLWQEVTERLMREEGEQLLRERAKDEVHREQMSADPRWLIGGQRPYEGYLSEADSTQIKRDFFESYMLARNRANVEAAVAVDGSSDSDETIQAASAHDARLLTELVAYDAHEETPQTEGVVADTDEDALDDVAVVEATVVPAEGSRTYAWSAVTSFRPARLQLESLPRATRQLSSLTLLWANDNALTTLPMLPPSLTELYLQRNELSELPASVIGELPSLRSLWVHENRLSALPEAIGALVDLRDLVAFRNRLERLPDSLFSLSTLRELRLDENELEAVPASLGDLTRLQKLDLSKNRLVTLPRTIGKLQSLCSLRIWFNRLTCFPAEIGELTELEELTASQNEIVALPASFGALSDRLVLNLIDNPMQKPPRAVAERGVAAIRRYFNELAKNESVVSRWAKLVIAGDGEVGKTSLLRLLQWRRAAPTAVEERTVQLDLSMLGVKSSKEAGSDGKEALAALFSCWDLSGQPEYAAAQQPFITSGPLFLLAVPAHRCRDDEYVAVLGRWLEVLQASAPGAIVQIVVTQADRLLSPAQLAAAVEHHELRTTKQCIAGVPSASRIEGRLYFECVIHSKGSSCLVGWATPELNSPDAPHESLGNMATAYVLNLSNGKLRHRRREHHNKLQLAKPVLMEYADGDVIGLAVDFAVGELWIARNDEWFVAFTCDPFALVEAGGLYPAVEGIGLVCTLNCGAAPFVHRPPDSRYYSSWAPEVPVGFCEQIRGTPEAFVLSPLWCAEALKDAATPAVEWIRSRVVEHRSSYERRCADLDVVPSPPPLRVQDAIPVCSALPGGEASGEAVRAQLEAISCASPPLLPSIGFSIPASWLPPIAFLRALRDGISPTYAVRRAVLGLEQLDPRADGDPPRRRSYARVTELRTLWEGTAPAALVATGGTESVDAQLVDDALMLLAAQGEVFVSAGIAYLDPSFVASLMKPLVDHRLSTRASVLSAARTAAHGSALLSALDELTTAGVLREELLALLWQDTGLQAADFAAVLTLLEETGIIFPIGTEVSGRRHWVMPMRLPKQPPSLIPGEWNQGLFSAQEGELARAISLDLGAFVPPGLLERLMAACYPLGRHHYFWRRPHGAGALIFASLRDPLGDRGQDGSSDCGRVEARLLFDVDVVDASVRSEAEDKAGVRIAQDGYALRFELFVPHAHVEEGERLLTEAKALFERLLHDFPGVITSALRGAARWRRVEPKPRAANAAASSS